MKMLAQLSLARPTIATDERQMICHFVNKIRAGELVAANRNGSPMHMASQPAPPKSFPADDVARRQTDVG
jgi:hypothetical protein